MGKARQGQPITFELIYSREEGHAKKDIQWFDVDGPGHCHVILFCYVRNDNSSLKCLSCRYLWLFKMLLIKLGQFNELIIAVVKIYSDLMV